MKKILTVILFLPLFTVFAGNTKGMLLTKEEFSLSGTLNTNEKQGKGSWSQYYLQLSDELDVYKAMDSANIEDVSKVQCHFTNDNVETHGKDTFESLVGKKVTIKATGRFREIKKKNIFAFRINKLSFIEAAE